MRFWIPNGYKSNFRDFIIDLVTYDIFVYIDIYDGYDRLDTYKYVFRMQLQGNAYMTCKQDGYNPDEEIIHLLLNSDTIYTLVNEVREELSLYNDSILDIRVSGYIPLDGKEVEGHFV